MKLLKRTLLLVTIFSFCSTHPKFFSGIKNSLSSLKNKLLSKPKLANDKLYPCKKIDFVPPRENLVSKTLDNGLEIVAYKNPCQSDVFVQVKYNVGSCSEGPGERGLAHLVEHMIFKGTTDKLSEIDVFAMAEKYGASANAVTSYNSTSYYVLANKAEWPVFLEVMADCMANARFDEQHLASELHRVIQELRMYKDSAPRQAFEAVNKIVFREDQPYHYPVIGLTEDLVKVSAAQVKDFYKRRYGPNNAILTIVGDIDPTVAVELAAQAFGPVASNDLIVEQPSITTPPVLNNFQGKNYTLKQNVEAERCSLFWVIPNYPNAFSLICRLLGQGLHNILQAELVDKQQIATHVTAHHLIEKEGGLLFIDFLPVAGAAAKCRAAIEKILEGIANQGFSQADVDLATTEIVVNSMQGFESNFSISDSLSEAFFQEQKYDLFFSTIADVYCTKNDDLHVLVKKHLMPSQAGFLQVLPFSQQDKQSWAETLAAENGLYQDILANHQRTTPVEEARFAKSAPEPTLPTAIDIPFPDLITEISGAKLFYKRINTSGFAHFGVYLKHKDWISQTLDAIILDAMLILLLERSEGYTKADHVNFFQAMGVSNYYFGNLQVSFSCLKDNFAEVLQRVFWILKNPKFDESSLQVLKSQLFHNLQARKLNNFFLAAREITNRCFPDSILDWNLDQVIAKVNNLTLQEVCALHKKYMHAGNLTIAMAGNLEQTSVVSALTKELANIVAKDGEVLPMQRPMPIIAKFDDINIELYNNQTLLYMIAVNKLSTKDKAALCLSNLISQMLFTTINSRVNMLMHRYGLFYGASGSFAANPNELFSWDYIATLVNGENVAQTKLLIAGAVENVAQNGFSQVELDVAKQQIAFGLSRLATGVSALPRLYLGLDSAGWNCQDILDEWQQILNVTLEDVNAYAREICKVDHMTTIIVGPKSA